MAKKSLALRPLTDTEAVQEAGRDGLMITNFATGQTLTYQLYLPVATTQFTLRYCGYSNSICEIKVDGESKNFVEMPRNGSSTEWIAATVNVPLKAGCHTVSLQLFTGSCLLSAFQLQ